ncbi:MAG: transglutaminase family protein [Candidatus Sumerlaeaceae bacterium]
MHYSVRHITRFHYSLPITESLTELRMQPTTDGQQVCRSFELNLNPRAAVTTHPDHFGNIVHHFDVPKPHGQLIIAAKSLVEVMPFPEIQERLPESAWDELDAAVDEEDLYEMLMPSRFTHATTLLIELGKELNMVRRDDPLTVLRQLNTAIYDRFAYEPQATQVDSTIDDALTCLSGVCQDYAHVMLTIMRQLLRIPSRYVSGYLFHREDANDRSAVDATHAWVEGYLPRLGWVGFDPTNNLVAAERHIRVAVGRDYSDVPPTRGVHKGSATSELSVAVQVAPADAPVVEIKPVGVSVWSPAQNAESVSARIDHHRQMQQQQQQQQ